MIPANKLPLSKPLPPGSYLRIESTYMGKSFWVVDDSGLWADMDGFEDNDRIDAFIQDIKETEASIGFDDLIKVF